MTWVGCIVAIVGSEVPDDKGVIAGIDTPPAVEKNICPSPPCEVLPRKPPLSSSANESHRFSICDSSKKGSEDGCGEAAIERVVDGGDESVVFVDTVEGGSDEGVVCDEAAPLLSLSATEAPSLKYCSNMLSTSIKSEMEGVPGAYCTAVAPMMEMVLPEFKSKASSFIGGGR